MKIGPIGKTRVAVARKLVRAIFGSPGLHRRLQKSHAIAGLDPDLAVMLAQGEVAALRGGAARAAPLATNPHGTGVAGDSAGGNLSAVVGLQTRGEARRPALCVLLYPALDATCALPSHRELAEGFFLNRSA